MTTVAEALREAAARIADYSADPRLDAEFLMAEALGVSRSDMLLRHMGEPAPPDFERYLEMVRNHTPIAYIIGRQDFWTQSYKVTPDVLIPRQDSETTLRAALATPSSARRVLDCGTGSGALLLSYLSERPAAVGVGVDRSAAALEVARENAERLDLAERCEFLAADWNEVGALQALGTFDLVIANPPYVETGAELDRSVRDHEPHGALFAGPEGLDDYRVLIPQLPRLLEPGGHAVLEIGAAQADAVRAIAAEAGFAADLHRDLASRPRALVLSL